MGVTAVAERWHACPMGDSPYSSRTHRVTTLPCATPDGRWRRFGGGHSVNVPSLMNSE